MSLREAHRFILQAEDDAALRERIRRLRPDADREDLVRVGAAAGFDFTGDELAEAFRLDARMRAAALQQPDQVAPGSHA